MGESKTGSKNLVYWCAQVVGWSIYGFLLILATYANRPADLSFVLLVNIFVYLLLAISLTHLMRVFFIYKGWLGFKLTPLVPRIFVLSFIFAILLTLSTNCLYFFTKPISEFHEGLSVLKLMIQVLANMLLLLFWNALYFLYHFFIITRKQELDNLSIVSLKNEIELRNLRTQLNPHFLFNSLNAIRALIEIEPAKAKSAVTILSNLLRNSLVCSKLKFVSMEEEVEMVTNYLDLEKLRFEERLEIRWEIDSDLKRFVFPPFCLQTMVENAVKHGVSKLIDGGVITIKAYKQGGNVCLEVINTGVLASEIDLGIGVKNIRRRLDIQYNGKASFELFQTAHEVHSKIVFLGAVGVV
jgi:two-component system, LytTR family, sensor kinase